MYTIEEVCNKLNVLQSAVHNELKRISKEFEEQGKDISIHYGKKGTHKTVSEEFLFQHSKKPVGYYRLAPYFKAWDLLFHNPYLKAKGFLYNNPYL